MFIFRKNENKGKQNFFNFRKDPTRFNLAPTYLYRVENQGYVVLWVENCLIVVDIF